MGFFKNLTRSLGFGEKEEGLPEATTIDNLRQGGTINFPMMFEPAAIAEIVSSHNQGFQITKRSDFKFQGKNTRSRVWAELDYGALFLARRGSNAELIKPVTDVNSFLGVVEVDSFRALLDLDESEIIRNEHGHEEVKSEDRVIKIESAFSTLKEEEEFLVQADELGVVSDFYDVSFRFVEAKNLNSTAYLYVFVLESGETLLFESTLIPLHELDFV